MSPETALQTEYNPAVLFSKLAKIMGELERLKKSGHNNSQNYDFATDADVLDTIRPMLAAHNIAFLSSMTSYELTQVTPEKKAPYSHALATFEYKLCCGDSGVIDVSTWTGEAIDYGDKAISKAATSGLKYWLLKTFMLSTGDPMEDADNASPKQEQRKPAQQQQQPAPAQTASTSANSSAAQKQASSQAVPQNAANSPSSDNPLFDHVPAKKGNSPEPVLVSIDTSDAQLCALCPDWMSIKDQTLTKVFTPFYNAVVNCFHIYDVMQHAQNSIAKKIRADKIHPLQHTAKQALIIILNDRESDAGGKTSKVDTDDFTKSAEHAMKQDIA